MKTISAFIKFIFELARSLIEEIMFFLKKIARHSLTQTSNPNIVFYPRTVANKTKFESNTKVFRDSIIYDSSIGAFSYIGSNCRISYSKIGRFCSIASNVTIGLGKHPTSKFVSTYPGFYSNASGATHFCRHDFVEHVPVTIGNDVWIGEHACILDGVQIGDGAIVGAFAVVTKDVEPYAIVAGNPAKLIRKRFSDSDIEFLCKTKWWEWPIEKIQKFSPYFHDIAVFKQIINTDI
ncbi:MAG: CatB-related O-acetyltransferase [candidate division WOR-3 bacterium]